VNDTILLGRTEPRRCGLVVVVGGAPSTPSQQPSRDNKAQEGLKEASEFAGHAISDALGDPFLEGTSAQEVVAAPSLNTRPRPGSATLDGTAGRRGA
jgi:hypothetical protein